MKTATINYYMPGTRVMAKDYHSHARDMKPGTITTIYPRATILRNGTVEFSVSYEITLDRTTANGKPVRVSSSTVELINE